MATTMPANPVLGKWRYEIDDECQGLDYIYKQAQAAK